MHYIPGRGKS